MILRRAPITVLLVLMLTAAACTSDDPTVLESGELLRGVNLSGAEFGFENLPGEFGVDYIYPSTADVEYFTGLGASVIRLPFRWERLQLEPGGALDPVELARLDAAVDAITGNGAAVIVDPHNFARYDGAVVGGDDLAVDALSDLWARLALRYRDNELVILGLMNEPFEMSSEVWVDQANRSIAAIRETGADNLILVPGNEYSGAHAWDEDFYGTPNSEAMLAIVDPGDNFAIEVHQYLDGDSSGGAPECVSSTVGSERLEDFNDWLGDHDLRGFLGEFAGGESDVCSQALTDMLRFVEANDDRWLGWTYWGAGPWWGDYIFEIQPDASGAIDDPQMVVLAQFFAEPS